MRLLLLLLWLSGPVAAEVYSIQFNVEPHDAEVWLFNSNVKLGTTDRAIPLELAPYIETNSSLNLQFRREGYHSKNERVGVDQLVRNRRYPENGRLILDARHPWVPIQYWIQRNSVLSGSLAAFLAVSLLGIGLPLWQRHRRLLKRGALLEKYRAADHANPHVGSLLGSYRLLECLGRGGTATIYRGVPDDTLDEARSVAVKLLYVDDEGFRARFIREWRAVSRLNHPNIVRVLDSGEDGSLMYLVMEHLKGSPLRRLIRQPMSLEQAASCFKSIAAGVIHAHQNGIVHRDLKPDNIVLDERGVPRIVDFGLAVAEDMTRVTRTGDVVGTPAYLAPEVAISREVTPAAGQYAMGIMLYEMVAGQLPFPSDSRIGLRTAPPPLHDTRPDIPEAVDAVIRRMVQPDPAARFPSMEAALPSTDDRLGQGELVQ